MIASSDSENFSPAEKLKKLDDRIGVSRRQELLSLEAESDPELWAAGVLNLATRLEQEDPRAAAALLEGLIGSREQLPTSTAKILQSAERRQQALVGAGRIGDRAEALLGRFVKEASDPATLAGFLVGGSVYKLSRGYLLGRLTAAPSSWLSRGLTARLLAAGGAFGLEVPAFLGSTRLANQALGRAQDWSAATLRHELMATGITLFFLKSSGAAAQWAGQGLRGSAALRAAPGLSQFTEAALPQLGMFGGIVLGHGAEARLGLRPAQSADHFFLDALVTLMQFNVGARLGDKLLGSAYARAMREVEIRSELSAAPPTPPFGNAAALATDHGSQGRERVDPFRVQVLQMSADDKGGKDTKVIPLFPNGNGRKIPEPQILTSEQKAQLLDQLLRQADIFLSEMAVNLGKFLSDSEVYAGYLERGLDGSVQVEPLRRRLEQATHTFLQQYHEAQAFQRDLTAFAFGHPDAMNKSSKFEEKRDSLRDIVANGRPLLQAFEAVQSTLHSGAYHETYPALRDWYRFTPPVLLFERSHVLNFTLDAAELVPAARLLGMAYGHSTRYILRDPKLPAPKSALKKLFEALENIGDKPYSRLLLERFYSKEEGAAPTPREGLAFGGSYEAPFRSWLSLHLPALLLHQRGNVGAVEHIFQPLELFMDRSTAQAGRETLRWLGDALKRSGNPVDWARDAAPSSSGGKAWKMLRQLDPTPEKLAKNLGASGPKAILAHSIYAFLRGSEDPAIALLYASQAPEGIRDEVMALSGALGGAYLGRGGLNRWNLLAGLREAFPNREIGETMLRSWEEGILALPLTPISLRFGRTAPKPTWPRIVPDGKLTVFSPDWTAFQDGFFERQSEIELLFYNVVRDGTKLLVRPPEAVQSEVVPVRDGLMAELKKIEAAFKALQSYFKDGEGRLRKGGQNQPLRDELKRRLGRLEEGLNCYRGFLAALQFASRAWGAKPREAELQAVRDELFRVIEAFEVPKGTPIESSLSKVLMEFAKEELAMAKARAEALAHRQSDEGENSLATRKTERPDGSDSE